MCLPGNTPTCGSGVADTHELTCWLLLLHKREHQRINRLCGSLRGTSPEYRVRVPVDALTWLVLLPSVG